MDFRRQILTPMMSEFDVFTRQNMTSNDDPHIKKVKYL